FLSVTASPLFFCSLFSFNDPAPTELYTLSLHDALPILAVFIFQVAADPDNDELIRHTAKVDPCKFLMMPDAVECNQKRILFILRSEEHTSELQSRFDLVCRLLLEKKKKKIKNNNERDVT